MRDDREIRTVEDLPLALTVAEVADLMRVSRYTIYGLLRRHAATGGREGLPSMPLGRALRIPRAPVGGMLGLSRHQDPGHGD